MNARNHTKRHGRVAPQRLAQGGVCHGQQGTAALVWSNGPDASS